MKNKDKKKKSDAPSIDYSDDIKRLNRVVGQIEGVSKMLEGGRRLDDVLTQCKAIHSALKSVETRILKAHLEQVLNDIAKLDKKKSREQYLSELETLFKQS